jgi:hypothetical protein
MTGGKDMGKKTSGQGWFLVRIDKRGTRPVAVLTGDHFGPDQKEIANAVAGVDGNDSIKAGGSPVYLVKDSVVAIALGASKKKSALKLTDCRDGVRGKPCGKCNKCIEAKERMFTRIILGSIELPRTELSDRVRDAVQNVIGLQWADAPWCEPMTEDEVNEVFEELGVTPANEGE